MLYSSIPFVFEKIADYRHIGWCPFQGGPVLEVNPAGIGMFRQMHNGAGLAGAAIVLLQSELDNGYKSDSVIRGGSINGYSEA